MDHSYELIINFEDKSMYQFEHTWHIDIILQCLVDVPIDLRCAFSSSYNYIKFTDWKNLVSNHKYC